ncbi:MAG TPA: hypothetical protein PKG48_08520 [Bacteroidales bacterium]|nr:hypothetical protein [Bacteroidales bacterium]
MDAIERLLKLQVCYYNLNNVTEKNGPPSFPYQFTPKPNSLSMPFKSEDNDRRKNLHEGDDEAPQVS